MFYDDQCKLLRENSPKLLAIFTSYLIHPKAQKTSNWPGKIATLLFNFLLNASVTYHVHGC